MIHNDARSVTEVKAKLAMVMNVMTKLTKLWKNKSISTKTKLRLVKALAWTVATYGCESWTLRKEEEKRIQAFENKCLRKMLRIPWTKLLTTDKVYSTAGTTPELLTHLKRGKLAYFGHALRIPENSIEAAVTVGLTDGSRERGRPRLSWLDNITYWTGLNGTRLLAAARNRNYWQDIIRNCSQPSQSDVGDVT